MFGEKALGAGLLGAGLFRNFPQVPDLPQSAENLRAQAGNDPLGQQARGVLSSNLDRTFNPLTSEELTAGRREIERSFDEREEQVRDLFRNVRPGTNEFTDSALAKSLTDVRRERTEALSDFAANRTRDVESRFFSEQAASIQQSLGASDQEFQQLAQIAQLDINQIALQLELDVEQARLFKETFANLGSSLISGPEPAGVFEQFLASRV